MRLYKLSSSVVKLKTAHKLQQLNIGYHGWHPHIDSLRYWSFAEVLKEFSKTCPVKITTVTNSQKKSSEAMEKIGISVLFVESESLAPLHFTNQVN